MSIKFYNQLDIESASNQIAYSSTSTTVTSLLLNNSGTGDASLLIDAGDKYILGVDNSTGLFRIASGSALGTSDIISLKSNGLIVLDQYGGGSYTGTEKYNLQVDSSGNIIETDAISDAVISGTGTANQVPKFQSDHVLIDSGLEIDASQNATFPGTINLSSNKSVAWPGGSIRAESNTLKLVATDLIQLQDPTQIYFDGGGNPIGLDIHNSGTATGDDAKITFETQGQYDYIIGIDRSASEFKISRSDAFGTNDVISLDGSSNATFAGDIAVGPKSNATVQVSESGNSTVKMLAGSVGRVGTYSSHNLNLMANSNTVLTLDTSQNATFASDIYMPNALYHTGDADTYYSFSGSDAIQESAGGDKGYSHTKNVITLGPTGASTSTLYCDLANRKVGFRTETPGSAFDVNGTIRVRNQLNVGHTTEQNLYVDGNGSAGGKYVKMGNYGQGNYFGISTNINQPKYVAAYGSAGKMVEERRIITIKLSGNAFSNLSSTGTTLIAAPGTNSIILPYEILIYKSAGTTGTGWPSNNPSSGAEIGFCQGNSINCSLTNAFDAVWKLPRALVTQTGTWFWSRSNATLNEVGANTYQLNKALVLRSATNLTALPTASWYVQIRYVQMNYTAGLVNNVDINKTSNG